MFSFLSLPFLQTFAVTCTKSAFLGVLIPWYQYLTLAPDNIHGSNVSICSITNFNTDSNVLGSHSAFLLIGLAIIDDLIRATALVAVGYIIYGGIQYVTSQGSPDATKKAQSTIINALIGLVVAIIAASVVAYLGNSLGKAGS